MGECKYPEFCYTVPDELCSLNFCPLSMEHVWDLLHGSLLWCEQQGAPTIAPVLDKNSKEVFYHVFCGKCSNLWGKFITNLMPRATLAVVQHFLFL